jgi:hypothetical protein
MNKARMLLAVGALGVIVAGGSAFTDAVDFTSGSPDGSIAGYASEVVTGGTVISAKYNTSADGHTITGVDLVMAGDTSASTVSVGLNTDVPSSCGLGTFATNTSYTCTITGHDLADVVKLAIAVQ